MDREIKTQMGQREKKIGKKKGNWTERKTDRQRERQVDRVY